MIDNHILNYPYLAQIDALKMLRNSNLGRHVAQICVYVEAPICASEAGAAVENRWLIFNFISGGSVTRKRDKLLQCLGRAASISR